MSRPTVLELQDVSRSFPSGESVVHALRSVSLELRSGETVAICGPSGSGKSTLLNIAGLTDQPSSGSVLLQSQAIDFNDTRARTSLRRSKIGFVFQYFNLLSHLTALENVAITSLLNGASWNLASARAKFLLTSVGLAHRVDHRPYMLSGGEMQRVAVARALAHEPVLILADEPTGNLDSAAGDAVLNLILQAATQGTAVLMATHSERASARCDRVLHVVDGTLMSEPA